MDLREVGYDDRDWINLAQDRDRWRAYSISGFDRCDVAVTQHLKAQELGIYSKKLTFSYRIWVFENMNQVPYTFALYVKPSTELYATPEPHNVDCGHPLPTRLL
ncbi:hypothetical protein ANN_21469 [Periplaneta americana]|uniref:Uncharacterized protein n=1 Tax=Periplaneta americana TaxID=6978 RepID=A0ABQ8SG74_PERAM|nr:hypothetical protein ANN_21469 [Periplaneta americana]